MKFPRMCLAIAGAAAISLSCGLVLAEENSAPANEEAKDKEKVELPGLTLLVPADWKQEPPANNLRLAQFQMPAAEGDTQPVELRVYNFGGRAGGTDSNIARWISQFSNRDRQVKVVKGESPHGTYYLVDIRGTYEMPVGPPIRRQTKELPDARMLGIILVSEDHGHYFLKMAGPKKTVSAQLEALRASIQGNKASEEPYELK